MSAQLPLRFDGADINQARDAARLTGQLDAIWRLMSDGAWRTLGEIERLTGAPQASISANLRNLRKERFGGHVIERRYVDSGLYEYRVVK